MLTKAAPSRRFNAAIRKILYGLLMCLIVSQPINAGSDTAELLPMGHHLEGLPAKPLSPSPQDQILQSFDLEIEPRLSHYGIEQIWFYGLVEEYAGWRNYDWQQLDDAQKLEIANTLLHRLPLTLSVESLRSLGCQDELLPQKTWLKLGQSPDPEKHYEAADDRFQAAWPELSQVEVLGTHWDAVQLAILADELLGREPAMATTNAIDY